MSDPKLIVAHGGAEVCKYRNVMEALEAALAHGADMFEFDVRRAADGTLVVHHDGAIGSRLLSMCAYGEAASAAAALGYRLPRVTDVIDAARGRVKLDVELKEAGYEDAVMRLLVDCGVTLEDVIVTSFEQQTIDAARAALRGVRTGLLVYDVSGATALELFHRSGASVLGPDYQILDEVTLSRARTEGVPLLPWTVNNPRDVDRFIRSPAVIGVITDVVSEAVRIRQTARL
jgi:glycerophosphoryl diester phosphodiesterase